MKTVREYHHKFSLIPNSIALRQRRMCMSGVPGRHSMAVWLQVKVRASGRESNPRPVDCNLQVLHPKPHATKSSVSLIYVTFLDVAQWLGR